MNVKGTAFLARKKMVIEKFGEPAWNDFLRQVRGDIPTFPLTIVATTLIPVEPFLAFQGSLMRRFFGSNPRIYTEMGQTSAQWALTEGPYKGVLARRDLESFVGGLSVMWSNYYDQGRLITELTGKTLDVRVVGLPLYDESFELMVTGFAQRALELFLRRSVASKRMKDGAKHNEIHHVYYL